MAKGVQETVFADLLGAVSLDNSILAAGYFGFLQRDEPLFFF